MYTQYVNGYDKAMSVFQDTMKENVEFANLVSQFQVRDIQISFCVTGTHTTLCMLLS